MIPDLGIPDLGVETMPGPLHSDEPVSNAHCLEGRVELFRLLDRHPEIARAVDQQHRGGIPADAIDGRGFAGRCL